MSKSFDVIVVGVGAMGSAACYQLARRGVRVLGLEQFAVPNTRGSLAGDTRMIRLCYYEHPDYVPLLVRAYELWQQLECAATEKLFHVTGGIYMGGPDSPFVTRAGEAARRHNLPHEMLDRAALMKRYPQFDLPEGYIGLYEPKAGFLLPERIVSVNVDLALRGGAQIHGHEPVVGWRSTSRGVEVKSDRDTYTADHLVIAGGAWSDQLIGDLGITLTVTRQVMGWVWPKEPALFELNTLPIWAIENADESLHYGFPIVPGRAGMKIAHHFQGEPTTSEKINRVARPEDEADFRPIIRRFVPAADGQLLSMIVCMYTNTQDSHFIIDQHPKHNNVTFACGFSGHGYKFASVMGEVLADLALDGMTENPIDFLRMKRFR